MSETRPHRTPLYGTHVAEGARMVDFAGWEMPVHYKSILEEHRAVRESAGIFDISHMGEFIVRGSRASEWLDSLLTNRVAALDVGEAQYTLMLNERGGVIDDLILYRIGADEFLLVVNAAKIAEDAAWLESRTAAGVEFWNQSAAFAAVAIQGPKSPEIYRAIFGEEMPAARNRVREFSSARGRGFAVTTGYTGEIGFEVVFPAADIEKIWKTAVAAGAAPCGLGARDTLRIEMCYPLNGADLSPERTPLEAGLKIFVDLDKPCFTGKAALEAQLQGGIPQRLVAIQLEEKAPPIRSHYLVIARGAIVGETTSGAISPSLGCGIALAYLPAELSKPGQSLEIEVRGKRYKAGVRKKPLYIKAAK